VFLVVIRYFRKMVYALAIGIFSSKPMYAVPILMMVSAMMALFIFVNLPYKKRLSNIVETVTEICISLLYLCLALINFNNEKGNLAFNITLGYICTGLLIFILLLEVFEVFCRSLFNLQSEEELRKKGEGLQGLGEAEIRKKAGEFFDFMFPRIRQDFGFGEDS
jgi:amino acid transporter